MSAFLLGYDVERASRSEETLHFLRVAPRLHAELGAPATFFICGRTLEAHADEFRQVKHDFGDWIDFQQHTYSHVLLKTLVQELDQPFADPDDGKQFYPAGLVVHPAADPETVRQEISRTSALLAEIVGVQCTGLTTPCGFYRGLSDRPDLLRILWECGIRFVRSWARNEKDWLPLPLDLQPFFYAPQGFPEMLEFPVHDGHIKRRLCGWNRHDEYLALISSELDFIAERDWVYAYGQHDWDSIIADPDMSLTSRIISCAKDRGLTVTSYRQYYQDLLARVRAGEVAAPTWARAIGAAA